MRRWYGITYPRILQNRLGWWLWRVLCCPRGWHLFDECQSYDHTLYCDACELDVELVE